MDRATREKLRPFIKKMLLIPYKHQGRGYDGADCGGGMLLFYRDFLGIDLPDFNLEYDKRWALKSGKSLFLEHYYKFFDKVEKPDYFDIILFQTKKEIANHGGIVIGNGKFIHISEAGGCVNRYNDENFRRRINGFYRYKKV